MESQNIETSQTENDAASELSTGQKLEKGTSVSPTLRVTLPPDAANRVQLALQALKERKADTKIDELLAEFLDGISQSYLDIQIEKRTPEDFYFEAAKNIPELRDKIIQQAKKALGKIEIKDPASAKLKKAPKALKGKISSEHRIESVGEVLQ